MLEAIEHYRIEGVATTLSFGRFVCEHPAFVSGNFDTHFVREYFRPELIRETAEAEAAVAAKLAFHLFEKQKRSLPLSSPTNNNWWMNRR
jgi:propionyl-CoA carboxylase alpha chain